VFAVPTFRRKPPCFPSMRVHAFIGFVVAPRACSPVRVQGSLIPRGSDLRATLGIISAGCRSDAALPGNVPLPALVSELHGAHSLSLAGPEYVQQAVSMPHSSGVLFRSRPGYNTHVVIWFHVNNFVVSRRPPCGDHREDHRVFEDKPAIKEGTSPHKRRNSPR